jgi:hypothetical protein
MATRYYFMTASDLHDWLTMVNKAKSLEYCDAHGAGTTPEVYRSASEIPELGTPKVWPNGQPSTRVLLAHASPYTFVSRTVVLKDSAQSRYSVYPVSNPGCVVLRPGGIGNGEYIISGDVSSVAGDDESKKLFAIFTRQLAKLCVVQDRVAVGPEAAALHFDGYRFCNCLAAPPQNDFKLKSQGDRGKVRKPRDPK